MTNSPVNIIIIKYLGDSTSLDLDVNLNHKPYPNKKAPCMFILYIESDVYLTL